MLVGITVAEKPDSRDSFPALTGLRAIAACMVFLHHYPLTGAEFSVLDWLAVVFREFHIGVTVFFVLSGFLIAWRYEHDACWEGAWLRRYWLRRFARIYPVYFAVLALTLVVTKDFSVKTIFMNGLLLPGFLNETKLAIAVAWTLAVEELFYLSAPIFFIARRRVPLLAIYLGTLGLGFALLAYGLYAGGAGYFSDAKLFWTRTFFGHCSEFFIGVYAAGTVAKIPVNAHSFSWRTYLGFAALPLMAYAISLSGGLFTPGGIAINNFLLPVAVGFLLQGLVVESTGISRLLSAPIAVIAGKSSYAFYLLHFGSIAGVWIKYIGSNLGPFFCTFSGLSAMVWYYYEEPLRRRISGWNSESTRFPSVKESDCATGLTDNAPKESFDEVA